MGWKNEYEHWRDRGHTWGPGIDDAEPLSDEEVRIEQDREKAFQQKLLAYSVAPRQAFVEAGEALKQLVPSSDDLNQGRAPANWREEYHDKQLALFKQACETLGYALDIGWAGKHLKNNREENSFSVSVEYPGWLPGRGGNLHHFFVCGIESVEDCLQLVADFSALGTTPTTWYGEHFHCSTRNTGELRHELIVRFGSEKMGVASVQKSSLEDTLCEATERSCESSRPTPQLRVDILQVKDGEATRDFRFESLERLENGADSVAVDNYAQVYSFFERPRDLSSFDTIFRFLENVYHRFNMAHPTDFRGHSLSMSDVVVLSNGSDCKAFYCDDFGWEELPDKFVNDFKQHFLSVKELQSPDLDM